VTDCDTLACQYLRPIEEGEIALNIIHESIQSVQVGEGITFKNLTMFPILKDSTDQSEYVTLDEALNSGTARVAEVSESGSVPDLQFLNEGDVPILLLDGEELVGAKQNRVLNLTILAPAHEAITIPVSCVEHGRWSHRSDEFSSEDRVHYSRGRSAKAASVSMSMASGGSRRSDQAEVWENISAKSGRMRVSSPTDSMSDIYEQRKQSMTGFVGAFSHSPQQVGAMFGIDGAIAGVDLFDDPGTLSKLLSKLVRSYALDAIETTEEEDKPTEVEEAQRFLAILAAVQTQEFPAVGRGTDYRLKDQMVSGGALVDKGHVIHLGAFPYVSESSGGRSTRRARMMSASQRRHRH
jgi:hypothetical protein